MIGAFVIVTLICFSGLIAYLGDQIGMKVGKKRISVFGLRPRYTSVLITVLTGILIATLTIFIILMINENVREALFNIQAVYQRRNELEMQLDATRLEYDELKQEHEEAIEEYQRDIAEFERRREELRQRNEELQNENEILQKKNEELQNENKALQNRNEELQNMIAELNNTREELESRIKKREQEIAKLNDEIDEKNEQIVQLNERYQQLVEDSLRYMTSDIVFRQGETVYVDTIKSSSSEEEVIENLSALSREAEVKIRERAPNMSLEFFQSQEQFELLASTVLNSSSERLIVKVISMVNAPQNSRYLTAHFHVEPDFIIYDKGDVISRTVIDADQDISSLTESLRQLLTDIRFNAVQNGLLRDNYGGVGEIDYEMFYNIQNKIQSFQGKVEISATAVEDIWREYALEGKFSDSIDFEIREVDDSNDLEY